MVALKNHEADRALARDIGAYSAFLVFGTDPGLVSERVRRIVANLVEDAADPFQLVRLAGDDLARDPPRLVDEAQTVPLFGGRRAILVDVGAKAIQGAIDLYLAAASPCPVVFQAGALRKDSPLRKAIERSRSAVAIECYPDGERDLVRLIDTEVAAAGLSIEAGARTMLVSLLGADRLASRSEIEKLILYARGAVTITAEHVEAAVADASAEAADDVIDAAFSGDIPALDAALKRLHLRASEAGTLIGAALRHAAALHRAVLRGGAEGGFVAVRGADSPRRKASIARQLASLGSDTLGRSLIRLGEALEQVRREPPLAESHAVRALWSVAMAARGRGARPT